MKTIELNIECPSCKGTGVYSGIGESKNVAVICYKCDGTGKFHYVFNYTEFTGRKIKKGIDRVYLSGYGWKIGTGVLNFDNVGKIDMDKEGVSYAEFLEGKMPEHIRTLACPMLADQDTCFKIKGFVDVCHGLNRGGLSYISKCNYQINKLECWRRFDKGE